jgi:hypothetical protein
MKRPSMKSRVQAQSSAPDMSGAAGRCSACWEASQPWSELSTVSAQARWRWRRPGPGQPGPAESGSGSTRVSGGTSRALRAARPAENGVQPAGPRAAAGCRSSAEAAAQAVAGAPAADRAEVAVWAWDGASAPGQVLPDRPGARAGALCPQAAVWGAGDAVRDLVRARVDGAPAQEPVRVARVVACGGSCHTVQRAGVQVPAAVQAPAAVREGASGGSSRPGAGPLPGDQEADGRERAAGRTGGLAACVQLGQSLRAARPPARPSRGAHAGHCAGWFREGSGNISQGRSSRRLLRSGGAREPKATPGGCAGSKASSCVGSPGLSAGRCGARSGRCAPRPGVSEGPGASSCVAKHGSAGPAGCWLPSPLRPGFASCTASASCAGRPPRHARGRASG